MAKMMQTSDSRHYVLFLLVLINIAAFWHRNLLYNLTAVSLNNCSKECSVNSPFAPTCQECSSLGSIGSDLIEQCETCQQCRMKHDSKKYLIQDGVCFDNQQFGILAGIGFTIMFSVCGIGVGWLADLTDRRRLLVFACLLWSVSTAAFSVCSSFGAMLLARVLMGVGQAFNAPCAYPIIASLFSEETRSTANGIYAVGTYIGSALSSLSIGLAITFGWQLTSIGAGLAGIIASIALYRTTDSVGSGISASTACRLATGVKPPWSPDYEDTEESQLLPPSPSGSTNTTEAAQPEAAQHGSIQHGEENKEEHKETSAVTPKSVHSLIDNITLLANSSPIMLLFAATSMRMTATYAAAAYFPVYFSREFPEYTSSFSIVHALCILGGGGLSAYFGGRAADRYGPRKPSVLASLPSGGGMMAIIPLGLACFTSNFPFAMSMLALQYFFAECWLGPGMTLLQLLLREYKDREVMSTTVALLLFTNTMVASVAPSGIAYWDDGTAESVRRGVFFAIALSYLFSALFFGLLARNESLPGPDSSDESKTKPILNACNSELPPIYSIAPTNASVPPVSPRKYMKVVKKEPEYQ